MATLQRSAISFRRQGSSGLIWEDRFFSGDLNQMKHKQERNKEFGEMRKCQSAGSTGMMERSRSNGGHPSRTCVVSTAADPPSPKVSGCGFCGLLGKPKVTHHSKYNNQ